MYSVHGIPSTYRELNTFLGGYEKRRLAVNTTIRRYGSSLLIVRFHDTDILYMSPDDMVTVTTDEWRTRTTKQRLNTILGFRGSIVQRNHVWWYVSGNLETEYYDNMTIDKNGFVVV